MERVGYNDLRKETGSNMIPAAKQSTEYTSLSRLIRLVAAIAIPVALQGLLTTTGSMIDTIMLARLGEKTVGAVGLCAQFTSLMFSGYWGFVGGGTLFFSQYYGARDDDGVRRSYGVTLFFMLTVGVLFCLAAVLAPNVVMGVYTDSEAIRAIGVQYLRIVGFAFPLQVLSMGMSSLLRSTEQVKVPLYAGIASVVTNIVMNYILIFGKLGLPAMGVRGAALATLIAAIVNVAVIVVLAIRQHIPYVLEFGKSFRWNPEFVSLYLKKCLPILANEILIGVGNMMINIVLGHQVDEFIAAIAVFRTIEGMVISFFSGFSSAAAVLVGTKVGAGEHEEAFSRAWRILYMCSLIVLLTCLVLVGIHTPLLSAMGLSGESFRYGYGALLIYSAIGFIRMGNWAHNDTCRAGGDAAWGSILEITFMFLMVQPVIHLANDLFHAPVLLVFALCYCDEPVRFVMNQVHMYSKKWIRPVSAEGLATIGAFREKYHVRVRERQI